MFAFLGSFGILLILRAASTESAPQMYPEVGDEEIIDNLAALAAASRRHNDPDGRFLDLDVDTLDYLTGRSGGSTNHREDPQPSNPKEPINSNNLQRQFAYRPNDYRFYIPTNQNLPQEDEQPIRQEQNQLQTPSESSKQNNHHHPEHLKPLLPPMKKNNPTEMEMDSHDDDTSNGGGIENPPIPSHIMTSSHMVDQSGAYATKLNEQPTALYIILLAGGSAMGVVLLVGAGICWYRIHERVKATADVDYPAYGVTGPSKDVSPSGGDRKLAQSAHMYHYQHQKQQMAALQKSPLPTDPQGSAGSDAESDDENEEGDYTVYECPGLAPAGDMEVKNPLYQDEPTPATPNTVKCDDDEGASTTTHGGK